MKPIDKHTNTHEVLISISHSC